MAFLRCCLLFTFVIYSLQQFAASQFLIDKVLLRAVTDERFKGLATSLYKLTAAHIVKRLEPGDDGDDDDGDDDDDDDDDDDGGGDDGNVYVSPIGVYIALAMTYEGSTDETKAKLDSAFKTQVSYTLSDFREISKTLIKRLNSQDKTFALTVVNHLYSQLGIKVSDKYQTLMKEQFDAAEEWVDFKTDSSRSRSTINGWVEKATSGKIKDLFPLKAISSNTDHALANAVHFKASWLYEFHKDRTVPEKFTVPGHAGDVELTVPMMHWDQSKPCFHATDDRIFKLVELPYGNKNFFMVIVVEKKTNGSIEFLTQKQKGSEPTLQSSPTSISLPKFNLQQAMDLQATIPVLGAKDHSANANHFKLLNFTRAYHKAFLVVDESGTEADRATGFEAAIPRSDSDTYDSKLQAVSNSNSIKGVITDFKVDRPFLFFVYDKTTGCVLFSGYIKNPVRSK